MLITAMGILASALLVWTMPDGPEHVGAQTIVGLQGMAFNIAAIAYWTRWAWKERKTIAGIWRRS